MSIPNILDLNNENITTKLLEYINSPDPVLFSQFTYPWLEQINEEQLHNKPEGKYFEYLRWLIISLIKNDKIINGKPILSYNKELQQILMTLEESSITGIIPITYGGFKKLLEANKEYFSCDDIYDNRVCISNSHIMQYLQSKIGIKRNISDDDNNTSYKRRRVSSTGGRKTRKNKKSRKARKNKKSRKSKTKKAKKN